MKVLITGVNGFIGSHLAGRFMDRGHEVVGIARTAMSSAFKTYEMDLLKADLAPLLKKVCPDLIIHCAGSANVGYSIEYPEEDFKSNTWLTYKILNSMKESGLFKSRFFLLSSAGVYGQPSELPVREDMPLNPISPYALHKKLAEDICKYYISQYGFDIKILRIFSAYGPGLKKQIFWDMYQKISNNGQLELFGTGNESRDYIYITDLTEAIYLIAMDKGAKYVVWNVANSVEIAIKDIAGIFMSVKGFPKDKICFNGQVRKGDPLNWRADISRLTEIGYRHMVSMEDGIRAYVKWVEGQNMLF